MQAGRSAPLRFEVSFRPLETLKVNRSERYRLKFQKQKVEFFCFGSDKKRTIHRLHEQKLCKLFDGSSCDLSGLSLVT